MNASEAEAIVLKKLKAERNFLRFPFFALSNRDANRRRKAEISINYTMGDLPYRGTVKILAAEDYIFPTPFDRKVHRTIEYLIARRGLPVLNPFYFSSYEILKELGMQPHSGANIRQVRESLKRLTVTSIDAENLIHDSTRERPARGRVFHLYNDFGYYGDENDDGQPMEKNWIELSSWYLNNINNNYVRPIDYAYYKSLELSVAQRLYELVGFGFYGIFLNKSEEGWENSYVKYDYNDLCAQLPLTRQKYLSKAQEKLAPGHQRLIDAGFFGQVKWKKVKNDDWAIQYYPGPRAIEEFQDNKRIPQEGTEQLEMRLTVPDSLPTMSPKKRVAGKNESSAEPLSDDPTLTLAKMLRERGIQEGTAIQLANQYPERILHTLRVFDFLGNQPDNPIKNKPAFLRKSIEGHWWRDADCWPEEFTKHQEQEKRRRALEKRQAQLLKLFQQELAQALQDLERLMELPLQDQIAVQLENWKQFVIDYQQGEQPSSAMMARREAELAQELARQSREERLRFKREELIEKYRCQAARQGIGELDWERIPL